MKEARCHFLIFGGLISATLLAICAQDLSYWLHDSNSKFGLGTSITVITFVSIGIYIIVPIIVIISREIKEALKVGYLTLFAIVGFPVSMWSLFVWAMWMG